ncbi:MAG TPA: hypothetical protein VNC50_12365, partial [Planctomycetia bacterium]|nr:hypothetical protein [Planctomycetia bacterium]
SAILATAAAALALAGKPPAAPPPPGTIYFADWKYQTWQIKSDGAQKAQIWSFQGIGDASARVYGTDKARWVLVQQVVGNEVFYPGGPPREEIFAFRIPAGGIAPVGPGVQITNFFPYIQPGGVARWSNGDDSFFCVGGNTITYDDDGQVVSGRPGFYRLNLSALEIEAGTAIPVSATGDSRFSEPLLDVTELPGSHNYTWAPDGASIIWPANGGLVLRAGIGGSAPTDLAIPFAGSRGINWAYSGSKILVAGQPSSQDQNGLYVIDPGVSSSPTLLKSVANGWNYHSPRWSPNGQHFVAGKSRNGWPYEQQIVRLKADGTEEVVLFSERYVQGGYAVRWSSDDP